MINQIEEWLKEVDNIIKGGVEHKVFITKYGAEFQLDFNDLIEITYLYMLPKTIGVFQDELNKINSWEQGQKTFLTLLKQVFDQENANETKQNQFNDLLSKFEKKTSETIMMLKKEWENYELLFNEFNVLMENEKEEDEKKNDQSETVTGLIEKLNLYQRINAYYVLALYAIIDVYSLLFYQESLAKCSKERLYDALKTKNSTSNPVDTINAGLEIHKDETINLKEIREQIIKKLGWEIHQESFKSFKEIRRIPAHQKTILTLDELKKRFPKHQKIAERMYKHVIKELKKSTLPEIINKPLLLGLEDLKIGLYLREIGISCFRYLVLNEAILQYYLSKNTFLDAIKVIKSARDNDKTE